MRRHVTSLHCIAIATAIGFAGAGSEGAGAIPAKSGAGMCALTPGDFAAAGVLNAHNPSANVQDGGASVYCVYAGKSSATGGIELDVFYPAGATPADARETFHTAIAESGSGMKPIGIAGADEAQWTDRAVSGGPAFATITVRRAMLVFSLGIPAGANAQTQLTRLADLLLKRF